MQSITKRLLAVISAVILMTTMLIPAFQASAASVRLNKTKIVLVVGQTYKLKVSGTKKTPQWSSSNKKIVSVTKKGVVKGLKKGTATITAKIGKKKYKCKVTVEAPKLSSTKKTVTAGTSFALKLNGTKRTVKWYTSNKKIATVSSKGVVKTLRAGSVKITAKLGGKSYVCRLTVKAKPAAPAAKTLAEIVAEYAQVYDATQKANCVRGSGFSQVLSFRMDGKEEEQLKKIIPSLLFTEESEIPLMPYSEDYSPKKCLITADDIKTATYKDNKNSTATIKLVPKGAKNPKRFSDPQGKMFNVAEDLYKSFEDITVIKWSRGTAKDNITVNCDGGYAEVTYDKNTKQMISAVYVLDTAVQMKHADLLVMKDKTVDVEIRRTVTYSRGTVQSKQQLVSHYNELINNLKNEQNDLTVRKTVSYDFECTDCSVSLLKKTWDGICKAFSTFSEDEYRFKSGKSVNRRSVITLNEFIPPAGKAAALSEDDIVSAKSVPTKDGGKKLSIVLKGESRSYDSDGGLKPVFSSKAINPVNLFTYEFPAGVNVERADTEYGEATVEATEDANGRLINLWIVSSAESRFTGKMGGISALVSISALSDEKYTVTYG